jgi:tRNA-Thr(GGU) m(6)t(6)A37 methyltransferase TsaA
MELQPIGIVRAPDADSEAVEKTERVLVIEVYPEYEQALSGIEELNEIQVLYWMHELDESARAILMTHPRGNTSVPKRGVFALRSPMRPNPIGSSTVRLIRRHGNRLIVAGLDAFVGSPVIDMKHPGGGK